MVELSALINLFYADGSRLGRFAQVSADEMASPYRELLAHQHHMTVTVEAFHRSPVDVRVLDRRLEGNYYSRKILLTRQTDGRVVQFGIMRVNFAYLSPQVQTEIRSESIPLGRVLINHNVLREIELQSLWRVEMGADLSDLFGADAGKTTYGRTAMIHCNGEPAVELLEIVAPA